MCLPKLRTMYEGKHIHYSNADNKLLCSFSGKLCNQRRLNGYGFCVRHILEDPTAPFKRCAFVAKSSNQMCTQAIPKHEERRYCNNHMQVLGMLPKKERKKKEKPAITVDNRIQLGTTGSIKAKFSLSSSKETNFPMLRPIVSADDPDDPYAFPDAGPSENKADILASALASTSDSVLGKSLQSGQGFVRSASDISSTGGLGGSTIAKYYPELAEKLEKMRTKPEPKANPKSRTRSSRTMNKLQTKIAQNKINEKLRKSQEVIQTDSNSSPLQISSPETGIGVEHSPSPGPVFSPTASSLTYSSQNSTPIHCPSSLALAGFDPVQIGQEMPPLPQVDTSYLATLTAQDNLGFQSSNINECNVNSLSANHLTAPRTPPRLPPPYPGSSTLSTPSSLTSSDLPASAFSPQTNLTSVIESLNSARSPQRIPVSQVGPSGPSSLSSLPFTPPPAVSSILQPASSPFLSPASSTSFPSTSTPAYPFSSPLRGGDRSVSGIKTLPNCLSSALPPPNVEIFSLLNANPKLGVDASTGLAHPQMLPSPNTIAAHMSLPPPPPYVPPAVPPKIMNTLPNKASVLTTGLQKLTVPHTKLHKLNGILSEKAAARKLKSELAVKYYSYHAKRKISSNCLVGPYLCSSEDDTEDEDADMLPWQPDMFSASSDEADDDDCENDIPMEMRPTKLSLLKTRLRRQWYQARMAYQSNGMSRRNNNQATLALIHTVRDSTACAIRALWQINHIKRSKRKLKKNRSKKKQCAHKNTSEGQCSNPCLPYTNHCLRHIMYNIDQQLFDYCTAKFADNTQCCVPVFDIRHELPLCPVHAAKADNYKKLLEAENKKRPRKKSKPPALTRPPRKGKKKKKGRYSRAEKPQPPSEPSGLDSSAMSDVDVLGLDTPSKPEESLLGAPPHTSSARDVVVDAPSGQESSATGLVQLSSSDSTSYAGNKETSKAVDQALELPENLSPVFDKPFELPLDQASRLLEESDFQEVVNKMPFDALDLFGKNGEPEPEPDTDQGSIDTAAKTRDTLEKLLSGTLSEEESMQLAMVLAQNLHTDADFMAEGISSTSQNLDTRMIQGGNAGLDMPMTSSLGMSGMGMPNGNQPTLMSSPISRMGESSGLAVGHQQQHPSQQLQQVQPTVSYSPLDPGNKLPQQQQHQQQQQLQSSVPAALSAPIGVPSVLTADLNTVYGQMESLTQSQLVASQSSGLNLGHIVPQLGLDTFSHSTAKTVIRHLPSESRAILSVAGTSQHGYGPASSQNFPHQMIGGPRNVSQSAGDMSRNVSTTASATASHSLPHGFSASSLPILNVQHRPLAKGETTPNPSLPATLSIVYSSPSISSQSSSPSISSQSSSPSKAKKVKLSSPTKTSVIAPPPPQQRSTTVRHMLQTASNSKFSLNDTSGNLKLQGPANRVQDGNVKSYPSVLPSQSVEPRLTLPGVESLRRPDGAPPNFSPTSKTGPSGSSPKLKLAVLNSQSSPDLASKGRLTLSDLSGPLLSSSTAVLTLTSSLTSSTISLNKLSGSPGHLTPSTNVRSKIQDSLFTDSLSASLTNSHSTSDESISVTVRHPSPLESVPTTVRHTLPDTFPNPVAVSSSPSSSLSTPTCTSALDSSVLKSLSTSQHSLALQPELQSMLTSQLSNQRQPWVNQGSLPGLSLHNGIPFMGGNTRVQLNKISGGQGVKNRQGNPVADPRLSALTNAVRVPVPVVCSPVTQPGFVQNLSTTTFKSSGSS